ncbi:MAG TPA: DNA polymerase IV [Candidatus Avacidaminococcus intestinavium]|uniref:DNA polymerase IV n=1 Tax=Candidatus Avacidaminococcus intestinavium TaxID=2840684 RepID=A0A9D1MQ35_9FIRM|nr:DNA polymerase IV [Candidatus Avacidaminococcus intestinavium]
MHVDMDAFFASVEQLDNIEYRGKPVIVGGQSVRGVVSTCSYEARKYGVRSAMSMVEAHKRCPEAIFVEGRMARYAEISRCVIKIFKEFSPCVEQLSIDEAFLDISGLEKVHGSVEEMGKKIKEQIKTITGLNASVGIAPNKFLAKLASDLRKPNGLVIIKKDEAERLLAPLPVRKIFGIGKQAETKLLKWQIRTIGELAKADSNILRSVFGKNAESVRLLAKGIDERPIECDYDRKSIGKESTYLEDLRYAEERHEALIKLCEQVGWRLRKQGLESHTVTLKVKFASFRVLTRSLTVERPVCFDEEIMAIVSTLATEIKWAEPVRLLGVSLSKLTLALEVPLFCAEEEEAMRKRNSAVDLLKNKFGENIIKRGHT